MQIFSIVVLYKTLLKEQRRLKREFRKFGKVLLVDNTRTKKGFAYGVNKGLRQALKTKADLFIIANPDITFGRVTKKQIMQTAEIFDIFGFAMKQSGKIYYGGEIDRWRMSGGLISRKPRKKFQSCDFVSGSFMVVKREVVEKIGLLEESFHMYYEDVEYCLRARQAGFRIGINSHIAYKHFELSKENTEKEWHLARNRFKFLLRHGSPAQKIYELIRIPKTVYELVQSTL